MADQGNCRGCGQSRPSDAPSGLCPACLLKAGLLGDGSKLPDVTITFGPASSSVLARFGEAFGKIPPILLRDTDSISDPSPVIRPSSTEIPDPLERSARLQLFGEIARGGMGAVLKGRDSDLGRDLAVKVLLESHREKPEMVRRFIEEAQIAGQLQHPGIVPIYELGAFGDRRPYFAMKLVKGHTLAEILANRKSPSDGLPRFLSIFESICQTMAYSHARGVIHRDLKPSNVMVGSFGEVQVMDWGLAKVLPRGGAIDDASAGQKKDQGTIIATARTGSDADLSQPGSIMGTPSYMAPEQARGEGDQVDERADVFALGSIFCELLTGEPAFTGRNPGEIQRKAARGELADAFARLDDVNNGHDPELIALARSCLAPERDDRPGNAGEVAERMGHYHARVQDRLRQAEIAGAEEKARAEEATKRVRVERERFRLTVALAASVLGMIVLGGAGWGYFAQQRAARQASTEKVVNEVVNKANVLRGQANAAPAGDLSRWPEALAAGNEARAALKSGEASATLRASVEKMLASLEQEHAQAKTRAQELEKDQELFDRLDSIRMKSVDVNARLEIDAEYAKAFREFGVDVEKLDPAESGRLFKQRSNPQEFASRLDDWTLIRKATLGPQNLNSLESLISVAQAIDDDPWRKSLRALISKKDHESALRLSRDEKELEKQSVRSLYLLAQVIEITRSGNEIEYLNDTIETLKRAWRRSPQDYQICRELGQKSKSELDRVRFATAAVAVKPKSLYARYGLADAIAGNQVTMERNNIIFVDAIGVGLRFPKSLMPRLRFKTREGVDVAEGPHWGFDPDSLRPENLGKAAEELRAVTRIAPGEMEPRIKLSFVLALQSRYDEAVQESREVSRLDPHFDKGLGLAKYFYLKGRLDLAIGELQEEIKKQEHKRDAYDLLGKIYHEQGLSELAFGAYREAVLATGGAGGPLGGMMETGKPEEVIALFRDLIKVHPKNSTLHLNLATMLVRQGKDDEAIPEYRETVTLEPGHPEHLEKLAQLLAKRGKMPESIALYREAMKSSPQNGTYIYNFAHLLVDFNDVGGAIAVYREAIKAQPENPDLFVSLAYLLDHHGKTTEAIAIGREAIKAHPKSLELHQGLADRLGSQGKPEELNAELDTILDLLREQVRLKGDAANLEKLGSAYLRRGKVQEAIAEYRKLIGIDPSNAETPNNLAWGFATNRDPKLRDGKAAVEFATKASELAEWKNPAYLDTLSAAYAESGDFDSAVKWQTKAIELLSDEKEKEDYRTRLKLYQEKKPYHQPAP